MTWNRLWIAAVVLLVGCHTQSGGDLSVPVGGSVDVTLPYTSGTGYSWSFDRASSEGLSSVRLSERADKPDTAGLPGGPGHSKWSIEGRAPGTAVLRFQYRRPWEKDTPPAETRRVRVDVR